jgi:hypothetical protein
MLGGSPAPTQDGRKSFARVFLSAALGTAAALIAVYGVWVIVAPETPHPEVGIPALLLALVSAATAVVLWRQA